MIRSGALLADLPQDRASEHFTDILSAPGVRIERIVSCGQASPAGFWYDQSWTEWVLVLTGSAGLLIEGEGAPRSLGPGEWLELAPHVRHRVEWTDAEAPTVWLAVHIGA